MHNVNNKPYVIFDFPPSDNARPQAKSKYSTGTSTWTWAYDMIHKPSRSTH